MARPTLDSALQEQLDELINEGYDAADEGNLPAAIEKWQQAWDTVPDPKLSWDYYGQVLSRELTNACVEAGDLQAAATWVEQLEEAYQPHSEASRMLVDFTKAKLYFRAGEKDLAYAYFEAIHKVKGKRAFDDESPDYYEFFRNHEPQSSAPAASATAGWELRIPEPGPGTVGVDIDDATHDRVVALIEQGDNYMDLDAPQAAAECYVQGLELLPQPYTQWEHALMLCTALGDACLALTQYAEAEKALRLAMQSADGHGNGYVWLRLGDALRGQGRDGEALEAYTSAWMVEGDELFEDEDEALAMLDAAGIRQR